MQNFACELSEILLRSANRSVLPLSQVRRPDTDVRVTRPIAAAGYSIVGLDVTLDVAGHVRLIEANGSNMGLTSFGDPSGDLPRARHMVAAARTRIEAVDQGVILIAFAPGSGIVHEHGHRAALVAEEVSRLRPTALCDANRAPGAGITVVFDTTVNIANHISQHHGQLYYMGLPIVSAGNPNLLADLVRRETIGRCDGGYDIDYSIFHEGPLVPLIHDKGAQQDLAQGTSIEPQFHCECYSIAECLGAISEFHRRELVAVAKMNAGSGGVGIEFFPPGMSSTEINRRFDALFSDISQRYPGDTSRSIWPLRLFQFVQSTGYPCDDGKHLWDMRLACLISPGQVEMACCVIRLCPASFDGVQHTRDSVLSNTTGRAPETTYIRSPLVTVKGPGPELQSVGVDRERLLQCFEGAANWCAAAWQRYG